MKKAYITPIMEEKYFSYTKFICNLYTGSLTGEDPDQQFQKTNGAQSDTYYNNVSTDAVHSNERGFGSDSPWESLW